MMISPETYYEFELKGKDQETILTRIVSLKQEINHLKSELENSRYETKIIILPSPLTRIKFTREYLEMAKRAYTEAGGIYKLSKAEQKDKAFNDSLKDMIRFVFEYGGYFGGFEIRTYTIEGDKVLFDLEHTFHSKPSNLPVYEPCTKAEFIEEIAQLHIGEWKSNYDNPLIMDGTQWSIEIEYEGDHKPVHISGSNSFPYNFDELLEFLEIKNEEEDNEI